MKNIHIPILIISFILLLILCSALSMFSVTSAYRFTWVAMNPWNGVEGIVFTIRHFLHMEQTTSLFLAIGLLFIIWWRIYALIRRSWKR